MSEDYEGMIDRAVKAGCEYVEANKNIKTFVIGISGGVDSAVTAAIARRVCDASDIKLIGVCMPIMTNTAGENERAAAVGKEYCHDFKTVDLSKAFLELTKHIDPDLYIKMSRTTIQYVKPDPRNPEVDTDDKVRAGNIKARIRMIHLYNLARKHNGLVLSTDNYTELLLGFWTLHGDVGDLSLIQELWKTEVFGMADELGGSAKLCADAVPTDGLGITNSDLDQLLPGWTGGHREGYKLVDEILLDYVFHGDVDDEKLSGYKLEDHPVALRNRNTMFKRNNPVVIPRRTLVPPDKDHPYLREAMFRA